MKYIILSIAILSLAGCSEEMQKSAQDHQAHLQQETHQYQLALQESQFSHERQMALEAGNHEQIMQDKSYAFASGLFVQLGFFFLCAVGGYLFYRVSELVSKTIENINKERHSTHRYLALMATLSTAPPPGFDQMTPEERDRYCKNLLIQGSKRPTRVIDSNNYRRLQ